MVDQYPFVDIGDLDVPADFAVLGVQRNEVGIRSSEVQPALVHGNAAMSDVEALVGRIGVMPDLMSGARIHRPDVVRHGEVQNAVDQKRRGLQGRRLPGLERPGQGQRPNVLRSDLGQRTMAPAGIIAVIARPAVGGRVCNRRRIETLRQQAARRKKTSA